MPEIFAARSIITMNKGQPRATHVVVSEARVLSVGTADDIAVWHANWPDAKLNDAFSDKVILPGFVEGHSHMM